MGLLHTLVEMACTIMALLFIKVGLHYTVMGFFHTISGVE